MLLNLLRSIYHYLWSLSGAIFFGFPSKKLYVIGITGTKGKSSTVEVISAILEEAGYKTALNSSVRRKIGSDSVKNTSNNSMPGRWAIQFFLWQALRAGCKFAIIEVTSQGVLQHRDKFISWDAAVFLNLSPEHIEAHGSYEKYREAKVNFFSHAAVSNKSNKLFIINKNDKERTYFEKAAARALGGEVLYFDAAKLAAEGLAGNTLATKEHREKVSGWLVPDFNLENSAAAMTLAKKLKVSEEKIVEALKKFQGIPGRMEYVQKEPFSVVIDYAHTPDSLEKVYKTLKSELPSASNRLVCVLGSCGGGRDVWKRPVMGKLAGEYCDEIYLTNEDPYDEDPKKIITDIKTGVGRSENSLHIVLDRIEAIAGAIYQAKPGDTVVITGKGSEVWLHEAHNKRIPWSDVEEAQKALTLLHDKLKY